MTTKTALLCLLESLLITYAGFVFVSWQFNPATWPHGVRFTFVITVAALYALNLVIKNDNSK
jgi:uncharacterized protein (DUF983 family)